METLFEPSCVIAKEILHLIYPKCKGEAQQSWRNESFQAVWVKMKAPGSGEKILQRKLTSQDPLKWSSEQEEVVT